MSLKYKSIIELIDVERWDSTFIKVFQEKILTQNSTEKPLLKRLNREIQVLNFGKIRYFEDIKIWLIVPSKKMLSLLLTRFSFMTLGSWEFLFLNRFLIIKKKQDSALILKLFFLEFFWMMKSSKSTQHWKKLFYYVCVWKLKSKASIKKFI